MPQMPQVFMEYAVGMLIAGMSTRAVARQLNVHFSTINYVQCHFREFVRTSNQPRNLRPCVTCEWVQTKSEGVGLCPPKPSQSFEIHRLGPNYFFKWTVFPK